MTATAIPVTQLSRAGTASVAGASDAVNGNSVANDGKVMLLLVNSAGVSHTLTVTAAVAGPDGLTLGTKQVPVAANSTFLTDIWPVATYGTQLQLTVDNAALTISPYRHS